MAALSLMTAQATNMEELLASLQPNIPPGEPSVWPLALGYWLVLAGALALTALSLFFWLRGRQWRFVKKQINAIQSQPEPSIQLTQLHTLLRWQIKQTQPASVAMNNLEFQTYISRINHNQSPDWLNQHYAPPSQTHIDWAEVSDICKALTKEVNA